MLGMLEILVLCLCALMALVGLLTLAVAFAAPRESRLTAHLFAWPAAAVAVGAALYLAYLAAQQAEALSNISSFAP